MAIYTPFHSTYFAHRIMLEGRTDEALAKSLSVARVDMKPHQVEAAKFALHSPLSKGVILADEVGLGKTIEACLVLAQKWAERRRRILLIVPATIRTQWQQELWEKFSLPSAILDSKTYRDALKQGQAQPFDNSDHIMITSYQYAASKADEIRRVAWDMVVIDEAHKLRNVYKSGKSINAQKIRSAIAPRMKMLLTATPLQNSLMELYGLVSVIDEEFFGGEKSFRTMYGGRSPNKLVLEGLRRRLAPIYKRHLRRDVLAAGHVRYTNRIAVTFDFEPHDLEAKLYEGVSTYLQDKESIAFGAKPNQLVLIGARKTLGSSIAAIEIFLENVIARLRKRRVADESVVDDIDDTSSMKEEMADDAALAEEAAETTADDESPTRDDADALIDTKRLTNEIALLEGFLKLARSIGPNAKGEKLLSQLPVVLDEVVARGGQRKVVIFTESVRTQKYLGEILANAGYGGQIVLLNGSNSDPESQKVYADWKKRKNGTDAISGSKSADMKSAIVDAFKSDGKTILIATESGAEGINLQFCSFLINFDLPWNPQRVEQRIGRCHRYGQKIDVTVVNMLNRKNHAEQRIYDLLRTKFKLFDGLFGASDRVLGTIIAGVDFEKQMLAMFQDCRTIAEIDAAFHAIEVDLDDKIQADMAETEKQLFDNFDASIVDMLRRRDSEIVRVMSDFELRLWLLARAELPKARFEKDGLPRFHYEKQTWSTAWPQADENGWRFFRLGDGTLADQLVSDACSRKLTRAKLRFDYTAYRGEGGRMLSDVEQQMGKSGWLDVALLKAETAVGSRDSLILTAITDDGKLLAKETAERLFLVPASLSDLDAVYPAETMAVHGQKAMESARKEAEAETSMWLDEETEKLGAYADDLEQANNLRAKELDAEAKAARKALRGNQSIPLTEKLGEQRRIKRLEEERDELRYTTFQRLNEIRKEVDRKLDEVAEALAITPKVTPILSVRWELTA